MPILVDAIRPFWLPGINSVAGIVEKGLSGWFCDEEFRIYKTPEENRFTLEIVDPALLLSAFAADINRPALASFETMTEITRNALLPKSAGWMIIKSYYAAYFAAHAILRMLGTSLFQVSRREIDAVRKVADIFSSECRLTRSGYFVCHFDPLTEKLTCVRQEGSKGANHESFWILFATRMKTLAEEILKSKTGSVANNQVASTKLMELCESLCRSPCPGGNWLSHIRNEVNYKQRMGVWYPYKETKNYYNRLFDGRQSWETDAGDIDLRSDADHHLKIFQHACSFLVSLCRELVLDMESRCPSGKSFHFFGSVGFINLSKQKRTIQTIAAVKKHPLRRRVATF
jgi:hypothetical protein